MVYDWSNRTAAEQAADLSPQDGEAPQSPASADTPSSETASSDTAASATGSVDADTLAWAREAYARLKAQQQAAKAEAESAVAAAETSDAIAVQPAAVAPVAAEPVAAEPVAAEPVAVESVVAEPVAAEPVAAEPVAVEPVAAEPVAAAPAEPGPEPEVDVQPQPVLSLLEQAAAQRAERQQALIVDEPAAPDDAPAAPVGDVQEPHLGAFDEAFTWSAEVLAAQGKRADQVSLEEIDWLSRLRQGLEKTRQGFVTQLLDKLGDDPLSPETLDELETSLLRADVGVQATDQVLEALRRRLNTEVVDPAEGLRFLKEQLRALLEAPISRCGQRAIV